MRREDLSDIFQRIPEVDLPKVQLLLRTGMYLCVDAIVRYEQTYFLFRGREAGNQDEGRAFFVPYDDVVMAKLERTLKMDELEGMYPDKPSQRKAATAPVAAIDTATATPAPGSPTPFMDPAQIAKKNLLDRIRAAKSVANR